MISPLMEIFSSSGLSRNECVDLSQDPMGQNGGPNLYRYRNNNPTTIRKVAKLLGVKTARLLNFE